MMRQPSRGPAPHDAGEQRLFTRIVTLARVLQSALVALTLTVLMACSRDVISVDVGGVSLSISSAASVAAIDSWRVNISGPSGTQTRTGSPRGTIEFLSLQPGSYTVLLEGFEGADLASRGQTTVAVQAGGTATASVSLTPVLPVVSVVASDPSAAEVGPDPGTFTISRTGPSSGALVVNVSLGGTATAGTDYQGIAPSVTMGPGQRVLAVNVVPVLDAVLEGAESVVLTIASGSEYVVGTPGAATVSIVDAPLVTVIASDASASEIGLDPGAFTISRTGDVTLALTVAVSLSGSATAGSDYGSIISPVTIPAGQNSAAVSVTPLADAISEGVETVILTIAANPAAYAVGSPNSATVFIADTPLPNVTVTAVDSIASEVGPTNGTFRIFRSGATAVPLAIGVTLTGSAENGVDYQSISTTQMIAVGATFVDVPVVPLLDGVVEGNETVILTLVPDGSFTVVSSPSATVTIADAPVVTIAAPKSVVVGLDHTCGLTSTGAAFCWGSNNAGQLGDGTTRDRTVPTAVAGGRTFVSLAGGFYHTCGLTSTGAAFCWGRNDASQLGDGTTRNRTVPTAVAGGRTFVSLAGGF
uniref:Calx-beta domain-containing protein n=1 Tax=Gemmatimonas sp. TaxID=1962908 RepID=UPI0035692469